MAVDAGGHAGGTSHGNDIAFFHGVANFYQIFGVMGIQCRETVAVVDFHIITIVIMEGSFYNSTCRRCTDGQIWLLVERSTPLWTRPSLMEGSPSGLNSVEITYSSSG